MSDFRFRMGIMKQATASSDDFLEPEICQLQPYCISAAGTTQCLRYLLAFRLSYVQRGHIGGQKAATWLGLLCRNKQ